MTKLAKKRAKAVMRAIKRGRKSQVERALRVLQKGKHGHTIWEAEYWLALPEVKSRATGTTSVRIRDKALVIRADWEARRAKQRAS